MRFKNFIPFLAGIMATLAVWAIVTFFIASPSLAISSTTRLQMLQLGRSDSHMIVDRYPAKGWNYASGSDAVYQSFGDTARTQYDIIMVRYETASGTWATDEAGVFLDGDSDGMFDTYTDKPASLATAGGKWAIFCIKGL